MSDSYNVLHSSTAQLIDLTSVRLRVPKLRNSDYTKLTPLETLGTETGGFGRVKGLSELFPGGFKSHSARSWPTFYLSKKKSEDVESGPMRKQHSFRDRLFSLIKTVLFPDFRLMSAVFYGWRGPVGDAGKKGARDGIAVCAVARFSTLMSTFMWMQWVWEQVFVHEMLYLMFDNIQKYTMKKFTTLPDIYFCSKYIIT